MKDTRINRREVLKASSALGIAGLAGCSSFQNGNGNSNRSGPYPSDAITVVVPWSQGGGTDRSTRALTPTWGEKMGGNFIVQNYPGGSTQVGGEKIYKAENDGYTVGMWNLPQMQATWLFQDAEYGADDFNYIGTNHWDPTMWFAPKNSPYNDMNGFLDYAKNQSDVVVGTTASIGNTALSALLVKSTYNLDIQIVNLEGGSSVRKAVLSGDVDAAVNQPWAFNPSNIGKVTTLGSHTPEKQELWPDTPSFKELGLTDVPLVESGLGQWKLMVTPGGLKENHPDRFKRLADTYKEAMEADSYKNRAKEQGNLDKILRYNEPEKTKEIVNENTKFMKEHRSLFENFQG